MSLSLDHAARIHRGSRGAYGFRLDFSEEDADEVSDLVELDPSAPTVAVSWRHAAPIVDFEEIGVRSVAMGSRHGGAALYVDRDPFSICFDLAEAPVPAALVHPMLTIAISILARWRGYVTLHAGAFETPEGAWGVMGVREAGKSAMLAALAERGFPVMADDLLAIHEEHVWAGPNCVDLRPETAGRFPSAHYLGMIGGRPRFRLSTPPSRANLPLKGFFVLDWHDQPEIEVSLLPARERLRLVYDQEYIPLLGRPEPQALLPLVGLPAWRLTRPADWAVTDDVLDRVLSHARDDR